MSLEETTKETWDKLFKEAIITTEEQIHQLSKTYISLLQMRSQYRREYKTNRIIHMADFDEGIISYKVGAKRRMGYQSNNQQELEEKI
jgi:hypothetical protein